MDWLPNERIVAPAPPVPEAELPLLRMVGQLRTNALSTWTRAAYEQEVLDRPFLGRRSLLLNRPDAIRQVLVDANESFARSAATHRILGPLLGNGLLLSSGPDWRHQRRTLAPAFTPRAVGLLVPHILSAAGEAVAALRAGGTENVDLLAFCQNLALEIAGRTMFSMEVGRFGPMLRGAILRYGDRLARPGLLDLLLPAGWSTPLDARRRRFGRAWMGLIDAILAERRGAVARDAPRDMLDLLLAARDPETGAPFTPEQVREQAATMILAGHETTATTLFWALTLLALDPVTQDAAAEDAAGCGEGELPPLVRAVLEETLRLYPPAYAIVRVARTRIEVAGRRLNAGDTAVVAPWVLHRHRALWRAPEAFDPGRFLSGPPPERFAYLPFGAGPRVCIGAQFATTEGVLVLAAILRAFRVRLAGPRPVRPVAVVTIQPDHVPRFRLASRAGRPAARLVTPDRVR